MLQTNRLSRFSDWTVLRPSCLSGRVDGRRPFFAGSLAEERMKRVRRAINEIRHAWDRYPQFMEELRQFVDAIPSGGVGVGVGVGDQARWEALLSSSKTWADTRMGGDDYSAIRLYTTSETGYRRLCPSGGVKEFGRRFPRRPASLEEGTHVRVEEDIACAAVAGRD